MTWRARAAPVGQSVRAGCGAPMLNVRHHIRMSRSVTPAPPSIAAGFVLLLLMWALQLRGAPPLLAAAADNAGAQ